MSLDLQDFSLAEVLTANPALYPPFQASLHPALVRMAGIYPPAPYSNQELYATERTTQKFKLLVEQRYLSSDDRMNTQLTPLLALCFNLCLGRQMWITAGAPPVQPPLLRTACSQNYQAPLPLSLLDKALKFRQRLYKPSVDCKTGDSICCLLTCRNENYQPHSCPLFPNTLEPDDPLESS